jgi:hypothetical protein
MSRWKRVYGREPWREKSEVPKETPTERAERIMFKGTGLANVVGDPLRDPFWLDAATFDERQKVRNAIEQNRNDDWANYSGGKHIEFRGKLMRVVDLEQALDRQAYELLVRRVDARSIAVACHMTEEEVHAVKDRHGMK